MNIIWQTTFYAIQHTEVYIHIIGRFGDESFQSIICKTEPEQPRDRTQTNTQ